MFRRIEKVGLDGAVRAACLALALHHDDCQPVFAGTAGRARLAALLGAVLQLFRRAAVPSAGWQAGPFRTESFARRHYGVIELVFARATWAAECRTHTHAFHPPHTNADTTTLMGRSE